MIRRCASFVSLAAAVLLAAAFTQSLSSGAVRSTGYASAATRYALVQPFSSTSIWNQPIGNKAEYVAARIAPPTIRALTADQTMILMDPTAPITLIHRNGGQKSNRCRASSPVALAPIPASLVVPSSSRNNGYVILGADGTTLIEGGAFARCVPGSSPTVGSARAFGSILGDGLSGGAGGSGLSTLGGVVRVNELLPGGSINHVLRVNIDGQADLFRASSSQCFRWPATRCDGYGPQRYGGKNPALKMGALLALPANLDLTTLGLTGPGLIVARALQSYGAYVSNDTARSVFSIDTQAGTESTVDQFRSVWGFSFETAGVRGTPWTNDIMTILAHLNVVNNNSSTSIGGGGAPLVPLSPPVTGTSPTPAPTATPTYDPTATPTPTPTTRPTPTPKPTPTPTPTPKPTATPTPTPPPGTPHVLVVMEENKGYAATLGTCSADPYFCSLASTYATYTHWHGVAHPSLPNYFAVTSGSTQGCTTDACAPFGATSLGSQFNSAGTPWTAFMESMPTPCDKSNSGGYVLRHDPFALSTAVSNCASHVLPYPGAAGLVTSLDTGAAGDFVWITPNLTNDMHDGSVAQGDAWLQTNLAPVLTSSWFTNFDSTVIVTMDEDDSGATNQIPTVVISSHSKGQGAVSTSGNHYGTLRAIEEAFGLKLLGGAASSAGGDLFGSFA